jgi:hypothetical protein
VRDGDGGLRPAARQLRAGRAGVVMADVSSLDERRWEILLDVARDVAPASADLDAAGRDRFRAIVDHALAARPAGVRRQFATFLRAISLLAVVRFGRPFERLDPVRRERLLRWLQDCPVSLLRKGFWGLKALVFMGVYAQTETAARIGYTPSFDGNARLSRD